MGIQRRENKRRQERTQGGRHRQMHRGGERRKERAEEGIDRERVKSDGGSMRAEEGKGEREGAGAGGGKGKPAKDRGIEKGERRAVEALK